MTATDPSGKNKSAPDHSPLAYTLQQARDVTGLGMTSLYDAIGSGDLAARKRGRRTIVLHDDLEAWLKSLPAYQPTGEAA